MPFRFSIIVAGLLCLILVPARAAEDEAKNKWVSLFNGKNLDGWIVKIKGHELGENFGDTFRVEEGLLKVRYDRKYKKFRGQFGHLFYKEKLSHYRLRVEYRFVGQQADGGPDWAIRNSGVMIHGEDPKAMEKDQNFPSSIEVQLLGGNGKDERSTANVCSPGTHYVKDGNLVTQHCANSTSKTYHGDQWVTVEIEVHGGKLIRHIVEGKVVFEYSQPQLDDTDPHSQELLKTQPKMLESGTISLQSESHPIDFRKVELMKLDE